MKLKNKREEAGLSQGQLADLSGVNKRILQSYEQGVRDINKANGITLFKLASALKCSIEELLDTDTIIEK